MRARVLAILLLLAGPGFAQAQCGYDAMCAGNNYSCGVSEADGTLFCWGCDTGPTIDNVPATAATACAVAYNSGCLIKESDSTLECWQNIDENVVDDKPGGTFSQVESTAAGICGLTTGGAVSCWGDDVAGFDVAPPGGTFTTIDCDGDGTCCGITSGALSCWGYDFATGVMTEPAGSNWTSVAAGGFHACAIDTDQSVTCWGENNDGEATPPAGDFVSVAVTSDYSCGVTTGSEVVCWGVNGTGYDEPTNCDFDLADGAASGGLCFHDTSNNIACLGWCAETTTDAPDADNLCAAGLCNEGPDAGAACATNDDCVTCPYTPTSCATTTTLPTAGVGVFVP